MSGRHHVPEHMRQHLEAQREELIASVPPNMVEGLRRMIAIAQASGLNKKEACSSVAEALRANQAKLSPMNKKWLVLEAGCMWLDREAAAKADAEEKRG